MMTTPSRLALASLKYVELGYPVFPCRVRDKRPLTEHGLKDASKDAAVIAAWWAATPGANVAVVTGPASGLFVLDIDGADGAASLAALEAQHGTLPPTLEQTTGKGRHLFFRYPDDGLVKNSTSKISGGLDIRGAGGYVIAPPSIHPDGREYRWKPGHKPTEMKPADAPKWLLDLVVYKPPPSPAARMPWKGNGDGRDSPYVEAALEREVATVAAAPVGQRNSTLNNAALALGGFVAAGALPRERVDAELTDAALHAGLDEIETRKTIASGLVAGMKSPREVPAETTVTTSASSTTTAISWAASTDVWPAQPEREAFHGVAGDLVTAIDPHTEADPAAVLVQFLVAFGNVVGPGPHFTAEADRHGMNLFAAFVGKSAKGRKGVSWGHARRFIDEADPDWQRCNASGLSSGEGLIWAVRDPIEKQEPIRENKRIIAYEPVIVDEGVQDKRLLVFEAELASVLRVLSREGNTLSAIIRNAWDTGNLRTMTKNSPARATGAHISIIAHITKDELLRHLSDTEAANGFGNRFLWLCVRRSKVLPEGGNLRWEDFDQISGHVREAIAFGRTAGEMRRDEQARELWRQIYPKLSEGRPGLLGAMLARAEAQVMRLACIYALLDRSLAIRREHLEAALAVWDYCEASAEYIFGNSLGDPVADDILRAITQSPEGMTRTDISNLLGRNKRSGDISRALRALEEHRLIRPTEETSDGRPAERFFACG